MTEPYGYDDDTDAGNDDGQQDERYVQLTRSQIRAMERDAKQARKFEQELGDMRRQLAFAKAGGEFTERQQKALLATIDGDLTAEAIREAAAELGFVAQSQAAPEQDTVPASEAAALNRLAAAAPGTADSPDEDPIARLYRAAEEGGHEGVLAEIQRAGHNVTPAG